MTSTNSYRLGDEPTVVLVSDLRQASANGVALVNDPRTVSVAGSRIIYRAGDGVSPDVAVAVLAASERLNRAMVERIERLEQERSGWISLGDLCSQDEMAKRLRRHRDTITKWRRIPTFPQPLKKVGQHHLWDIKEVRRWLKERDSYRPRKAAG